jgi:YbbR domain-containing protein
MSRFDATEGRLRDAWELTVDGWQRSVRTMRGTPGLLTLSMLLGLSLWVFVTEEENPTRVDSLGTPRLVQSVNVETGLAVANQLPAVEITIAAPEERWEEIESGFGSFTAFVDLRGVTQRDQDVPVQVEIKGVRGVRVVEVSPERVTVNLEDLTSIDVPVHVRPVGTMPLGYELSGTNVVQPTVRVSGPESLVGRVSDAVADLNVTGLTLGVEQTVTLIPRGGGGGEIRGVTLDPPALRVSVDIRQSTLVRTIALRVAVKGAPASGYRVVNVVVSPATITVEGSLDALQQVDAIDLDSVDVTGELTAVTRAVTVELPDGLLTSESRVVTVVVQIAPIDGDFTLSLAPRIVGLGDGLAINAVESVEITLSGPLPLLTQLTADDIGISLDVSGLGAGVHAVEVQLTAPEGMVLKSLQPETVSVTLAIG